MSIENPVIKFSPFEALLIGEKNKIAKRKPMKNTIFVTCLTHRKKSFDLRALFDVEEESNKQNRRVNGFLPNRKRRCKGKKVKGSSNHEVFCYEYEGKKIAVNGNKLVRSHKIVKNKKTNVKVSKVIFKPDFKFRETLEERIVHKIKKRKKILKRNLINNGVLSHIKKTNVKRHSLRGKNGKFIRKDDYESMTDNKISKDETLNNYVNQVCPVKNRVETFSDSMDLDIKLEPSMDEMKCVRKMEISENISDDISRQYYKNLFSSEVVFPALPHKLEVIDFDEDSNLMSIICKTELKAVCFDEKDDFDGARALSRDEEIGCPVKGLKMYERKKSPLSGSCCSNGIRELYNNSTKENHCINVNKLEKFNESCKITKGRRHCTNTLIDEPPTKDNHLLSSNKVRSLFYKTACGTETYLGNFMKPVLLNSTFGRLPDIS